MFRRIDRLGHPLDEVIREHLPGDHRDDWAVLKKLYELLNILDTKTSSLLTFDALIVAVFTIILQKEDTAGAPVLWVSLLGTLIIILSMGICVWVVRISWPFLKPGVAITTECQAVADVVDVRTIYYQWAWRLSFAGVFVLVLAFGLRYF
jgi:hypothetical protein